MVESKKKEIEKVEKLKNLIPDVFDNLLNVAARNNLAEARKKRSRNEIQDGEEKLDKMWEKLKQKEDPY